MSEEIKMGARPMQPGQPQYQQPMVQENTAMPVAKKSSKGPWVVLIVIVLVLVAAAVLFRGKLFGGTNKASVLGTSTSAYQAVFLTNGQVYFGKISNTTADYVTLDDIYYLQVVQPPLQGQQQPGQATGTSAASPQISLVKLGSELHGPVDEMHISRSQILFYEDLKADGQVVKAIIQDKAAKK